MSSTRQSHSDPSAHRTPKRGDVIRVRLNPVVGSEQGGDRPALVLSPDFINARSPVILTAAITSQKTERVYSFEALIPDGEGGLPKRSKVMLMQIRSIDQSRILSSYGTVSTATMAQVENALRIAAGLASVEPIEEPVEP